MPSNQGFADRLEAWLSQTQPKTLQSLIDGFHEKSFASLFVVLLAVPALPLPTGGATHILEIIAMILAGELILGQRTIWLPRRWRSLKLPPKLIHSTLPRLARLVCGLNRYARPRLASFMKQPNFLRLVGALVFLLSLVAFIAPPFSTLDTLPALGVVLISLALITEDFLIFVIGLIVGTVGSALVAGIGAIFVHSLLW